MVDIVELPIKKPTRCVKAIITLLEVIIRINLDPTMATFSKPAFQKWKTVMAVCMVNCHISSTIFWQKAIHFLIHIVVYADFSLI